jgi:Ser/Thr protein kinase RdoA (MazF antagonist)
MKSENPMETAIRECLHEYFGIDGELQRLGGENLNYLLTTSNAERHIVKVRDAVSPAVLELEFRAIEHAISAGTRLEMPEMAKNKNGNYYTRIKNHKNNHNYMILNKYIEGIELDSLSDISINLLKDVGLSLAEYDQVMEGFDHPCAQRSHTWNLLEADRHRPVAAGLEDPETVELLRWAFDTWSPAADAARSLPRQFIHGDANPENIMVRNGVVCGLIDLGDCGAAPVICELAICLAYLMMGRDDPLQAASVVADAYHQGRPLSRSERGLLLPLACGRLAVTVTMAAKRRAIDAANPNWFRSEAGARQLLDRLREEPRLQI